MNLWSHLQVCVFVFSMSLKHQLSLSGIQDIVNQVRGGVEYQQVNGYHDSGASSLVKYMLTNDDQTVVSRAEAMCQMNLYMERGLLKLSIFSYILVNFIFSPDKLWYCISDKSFSHVLS